MGNSAQMKLISMVEFVFQQRTKWKTETEGVPNIISKYKGVVFEIDMYANFLNQPLTIGMFAPCNKNGKVLYFIEYESWESTDESYNNYMQEYYQAKERVLFEGFECRFNQGTGLVGMKFISDTCVIEVSKNWNITCQGKKIKNIEDLAFLHLTLTRLATKQLTLAV